MAKARMLKLEEAIQYNRKVVWLELRDTPEAIPVTYYAEHAPFLRFDAEDRVLMIEVRADMYGKTWRVWNQRPEAPKDWKAV